MKNDDLVKRITELAERNLKEREKVNTLIEIAYEDIRDGNLDLKFKEVKERPPPHNACAIDGSRYIVPLRDSVFVIARAVAIRGEDKEEKDIPPDIEEEFKIASNYYDENIIGNKSILLMLYLETTLLNKCEGSDVIMIDGPIIDPPTYYEDPHVEDFPDLSDYVKFRANVLMQKKRNSSIIGISKRFSQRFLINYFMNRGLKQISRSTENFIASMIFLKYRKYKNVYSSSLYLGPIRWEDSLKDRKVNELDPLEGAYNAYKKYFQDELEITSFYYQRDLASPIGRIDVLSRKGEDPERDLTFVDRWAMSGLKEITIINKLADDLSNVSRNESERLVSLYNMVVSKELLDDELLLKRISK